MNANVRPAQLWQMGRLSSPPTTIRDVQVPSSVGSRREWAQLGAGLVSHDPPGQDGRLHTCPPSNTNTNRGKRAREAGGNATNCRSLRVAVHARPAA